MRSVPQHLGPIPMGPVSQPASVPLVEELLVGTVLPGSVSVAFVSIYVLFIAWCLLYLSIYYYYSWLGVCFNCVYHTFLF